MTCAIPGPPPVTCAWVPRSPCWGREVSERQLFDVCTSRPGELAELRAWEERRSEERAEANRRLLAYLRKRARLLQS